MPHVSVAVGVLLAIASLAVLIYFIHHTAHSIRIETQLAALAAETRDTIDRLYPDRLGQGPPADGAAAVAVRSRAAPTVRSPLRGVAMSNRSTATR